MIEIGTRVRVKDGPQCTLGHRWGGMKGRVVQNGLMQRKKHGGIIPVVEIITKTGNRTFKVAERLCEEI